MQIQRETYVILKNRGHKFEYSQFRTVENGLMILLSYHTVTGANFCVQKDDWCNTSNSEGGLWPPRCPAPAAGRSTHPNWYEVGWWEEGVEG
jgi:hypothetical protein